MESVFIVHEDAKISGVERKEFFTHIGKVTKKLFQNKCASCENTASLKKCAGCKMEVYCSRECQKEGWKDHKKECNEKFAILKKVIQRCIADPNTFIPVSRHIDIGYICGYYFSLSIKDEEHAKHLLSCKSKELISEFTSHPIGCDCDIRKSIFTVTYGEYNYSYTLPDMGLVAASRWTIHMIYDAFKKKDNTAIIATPNEIIKYIEDQIYKILPLLERGQLITNERIIRCLSRLHIETKDE